MLWVSAVASAIVDNIPFVATMIPTLKTAFIQLSEQGSVLDLDQQHAIWWSLSLDCLGGNESLIGASANLIVAGFAEQRGRPPLPDALKHAFPLMVLRRDATVYIYLRYLVDRPAPW